MSGYAKVFSDIVHSTVWREDVYTKVVWITMLVMADRHGLVMSSIPGLADAAKVSLDQCLFALSVLSSPDKYSRTKDYEGRRISEVDGGWLLLNFEKFRARKDDAEQRTRTAERVRRHRVKLKDSLNLRPKDGGYVYLAKIIQKEKKTCGMLKIGFSENPLSRLRNEFGKDGFELISLIPGGLELEKSVRNRFGIHNSLLLNEYFNESPEIRNYFNVTSNADVTRSNPIAEANTDASTDSLNPLTDSPPTAEAVAGLNAKAWEMWTDYRKKIGKPLKPVSILAAQRKLAALPFQMEAVEHSIANGWTGLFPADRHAGRKETTVERVRRLNSLIGDDAPIPGTAKRVD